jgi:hypothetical protein
MTKDDMKTDYSWWNRDKTGNDRAKSKRTRPAPDWRSVFGQRVVKKNPKTLPFLYLFFTVFRFFRGQVLISRAADQVPGGCH